MPPSHLIYLKGRSLCPKNALPLTSNNPEKVHFPFQTPPPTSNNEGEFPLASKSPTTNLRYWEGRSLLPLKLPLQPQIMLREVSFASKSNSSTSNSTKERFLLPLKRPRPTSYSEAERSFFPLKRPLWPQYLFITALCVLQYFTHKALRQTVNQTRV